jgi:hypothetical protein
VYTIDDHTLRYRWENVVDAFDMKLKVTIDGREVLLSPTTDWQTVRMKNNISDVVVDVDFYVGSEEKN